MGSHHHFSLVRRDVFVHSPAEGTMVWAISYDLDPRRRRLEAVHSLVTRSDTIDMAYRRMSEDGGATWSAARPVVTGRNTAGGMWRIRHQGGWIEPLTRKLITFRMEAVLPTDDPMEGLTHWRLFYTVSADGDRTTPIDEQIVQEGPQYSADHPYPGIVIGKAAAMLGDFTCRPMAGDDGDVLLPVQLTPVDENGNYHNPGKGYTFHESAVLIGHWRSDGRLSWKLSSRVALAPDRSTRGALEPTLGRLNDGRFMMVMRGSNDAAPDMPSYRWVSFSSNAGHTWTAAQPWTYDDGEAFYSPSSCSQLLPLADGSLLWLGNIVSENPNGSLPRRPFVIGQVDTDTGRLIRDSVVIIDDLRPGEHPRMMLSNFFARQDLRTGDVLLHMSRPFARGESDWTSDAYLYRIRVG